MNQILPYPLWVGHADDGRDFRRLLGAGVRAVVQLAVEELPLQLPREVVYCRIPLVDGTENEPALVCLAVHTAARLIKAQVPVLICCGTGMSRSPIVAAAALAAATGELPDESLKRVALHHPHDVSPGLWSAVKGCLGAGGQR